jgi:hypothetical protein
VHVDGFHLIHQHFRIGLAAENRPDRLGNIGWRKHCERYLVKKRLKRVVIATVQNSDIDWQATQRPCGMQTGESGAYDHDAQSRCTVVPPKPFG